MELRKYQREAVNAAVVQLAEPGPQRCRVVMACGTGKTFVAAGISHEVLGLDVLVLVPSLFLLNQYVQQWKAHAPFPFQGLILCSDRKAGRRQTSDEIIPDLDELDMPVTTDPQRIRNFLLGEPSNNHARVIFSTYASSKLLKGRKFDLAVYDEAHRVTGDRSKTWACTVHDAFARISKRLFMTATPRRVRDASAEGEDDMSLTMDEGPRGAAMFGETAYHMSFARAIRERRIVDYTILALGVTQAEVTEFIERNPTVLVDGEERKVDARTALAHIMLEQVKAMPNVEVSRTISYHTRVERAIIFAGLASDEREFVSGEMAPAERDSNIRALRRGDVRVVSNANCLVEGADIPEIDSVIFADPRRSPTDITQAVGRALRPSPGKKCAYILLPMLIEVGQPTIDPDDVRGDHRVTSQILGALRNLDEGLEAVLGEYAAYVGRGGSNTGQKLSRRARRKIQIVLPEKLSRELMMSVATQIVIIGAPFQADWYRNFENHIAWEAANPGKLPNKTATGREGQLGAWRATQANRYNAHPDRHASCVPLTPDQFELLKPQTHWRQDHDTKWWANYAKVEAYITEHGEPPPRSVKDIGGWCAQQRLRYNDKKTPPLNDKQRVALERLPGCFFPPKPRTAEENLQLNAAFAKEYGRTASQGADDKEERRLGKALVSLRVHKDPKIRGRAHALADKYAEGTRAAAAKARSQAHGNHPTKLRSFMRGDRQDQLLHSLTQRYARDSKTWADEICAYEDACRVGGIRMCAPDKRPHPDYLGWFDAKTLKAAGYLGRITNTHRPLNKRELAACRRRVEAYIVAREIQRRKAMEQDDE